MPTCRFLHSANLCDGFSSDTAALQLALNACGTVTIGAGANCTSLPLTLPSHLRLVLEEGARLQAANRSQWPGGLSPPPLLSSCRTRNITIMGRGTLDGHGEQWWPWPGVPVGPPDSERPKLLELTSVDDVELADITLLNPARFAIDIKSNPGFEGGGRRYALHGLKVRAPNFQTAPNTDGIDIAADGVHVYDVSVSNGDDSICIKSPAANILVENSTVAQGNGLVVGTAGSPTFVHNVTFRNISAVDTTFGCHVKFKPPQYGLVSNVTFEDVRIYQSEERTRQRVLHGDHAGYAIGIHFDDQGRRRLFEQQGQPVATDAAPPPPPSSRVEIVNVTYRRVTADVLHAGQFRCGAANLSCTGLVFEDVAINASRDGCSFDNAFGSNLGVVSPASCRLPAPSAAAPVDVWLPPLLSFNTSAFSVDLRSDTQTVERISPIGDSTGFSYAASSTAPANRTGPDFEHLGDVTFRVTSSKANFSTFSTAAAGGMPLPALHVAGELAAADLTPSLPGSPLSVSRHYSADATTGDIIVRYDLKHDRDASLGAVELTALGVTMGFDQLFSGRSLAAVAQACSFTDPFLGGGAGYVQVVSTTGDGPVLLVLPEAPAAAEAWRMLETDPTPRSVTFEGFYELLLHSKGYAEAEWANSSGAWNPPTSKVLAPGESYSVSLRLALAPSIRQVDATLLARGRPVAAAVPGYVLSRTMRNATLRLTLPAGVAVAEILVEPKGALRLEETTPATARRPTAAAAAAAATAAAAAPSTVVYSVVPSPNVSGRVGVTVVYRGGVEAAAAATSISQRIHYYVLPDLQQHALSYARHLSADTYYTDNGDAFGRAPAFLNWDTRAAGGGWDRGGVRGGRILQDQKAWIAGLSDECGASPAVGVAMSVLHLPQRSLVAQLEAYVDGTLWGGVQSKEDFGVHASLFFSGKAGFDYTIDTWGTWDEGRGLTTWRSYNYPHVTVVYWVLYRLARQYDGLVSAHPWDWYLGQALNTTLGMKALGRYNGLGLMVGSVWVHLLSDLHEEAAVADAPSWLRQGAEELEGFMASRAAAWSKSPFPFGSEMPWDSTGQEEVYMWARHFNYSAMAQLTLNAVTAYTPKVPHWAYQGNARRYFDFLVYGGEDFGTERLLHHYGAPLNAIPLLDAFRADPDDLHLLEIGLGGVVGSVTNIAEGSGVASMGWHGSEQRIHPDPTSCDFGVGFFGVALNSGAYLVSDGGGGASVAAAPAEGGGGGGGGWRCYLCNLVASSAGGGGSVTIEPVDLFRGRMYFEPLGLDLRADAGTFRNATLALDAKKLVVALEVGAPGPDRVAPTKARLRLSTPALAAGHRSVTGFVVSSAAPGAVPGTPLPLVRGAYELDLGVETGGVVVLTWE